MERKAVYQAPLREMNETSKGFNSLMVDVNFTILQAGQSYTTSEGNFEINIFAVGGTEYQVETEGQFPVSVPTDVTMNLTLLPPLAFGRIKFVSGADMVLTIAEVRQRKQR